MFQDPELFKAALDNLPLGVYMVDSEQRVVFWNHGAERISGYLAQDILGRFCREKLLVDLDENNPVACGEACQLTDSMRDGQAREADVLLRHKAGHRIPVHVRAAPLRNSSNKIVGATEYFQESRFSAGRDRRSPEPEDSASFDAVTGLLDAASGHLRLQTSLNDLIEHHVPFCVLMAEVDELVNFQQAHGKEAVQAAQAVVGRTLSNALRPTDVVVRWDERRFLTIVKNCEHSALRSVAERVRKMESYSAVEWWGDELQVTVSIGGTAAMQGDSVDDLLERAQGALRLSMQEGGNRVSIFSQTETRSSKG